MYLCGEIHYFRVPKPLWRDRLLKLKRAGGNCVSTYIPWNWHSPREDIVVFDDSYKEWYVPDYYSRNLSEFLELANQLGLKVIARPGPYICSEWDSGGHPNWLYTRTSKLRSLDPVYIDYTEKWYREVASVLKPYIEKNTIPAIQIENEYFWGNEKYIEKLYEIMSKLAPNTLLFTNENYYLTRIPNTIDDYPAPWDIKSFQEKLQKYLSTQPGLFKMFMELEGGWFKSIKYGYHPTNRLSIPGEWTEILVKTALGMGIDNFNIYMFHGGSNPGYYTGKYIDSSYDYEAAIREWGELSDRYYKLKRIYMFLSTLSEIIENTRPAQGVVETTSKTCSEIFTRIGEHGKIIVLRNKSDYTCYEKLVYNDKIIPEKNTIRIPPRYAKVIILDLEIPKTPFRLDYTSGEILLLREIGENTSLLVIYGDLGETTTSELTYGNELKQIRGLGDVVYSVDYEHSKIRIEAIHGGSDSIIQVESFSGSRLIIVYTTRYRAERTWILDNVVIISNIYYIGDSKTCNNTLCVECELDSNSCGEITVITPLEVNQVSIGDTRLPIEKIVEGVYKTQIPCNIIKDTQPSTISVDKVELAEDPVWSEGVNIPPATPLEKTGFYENGLYTYKVKFKLDESILGKLSNKILAVAGFSDYGVALLNNEYIASGYHYLERDVDEIIRSGENELTIIVESTGHPNDGFLYVPNGIYTGIYMGRRREIVLDNWLKIDYKIPVGPEFDFAEFLSNPVNIREILLKTPHEYTVQKGLIDSPGLYTTEVYVEKGEYYYVFDPGDSFYYNHYYRILLFINNEYIGPVLGPIEVTKYLKPGLNKIALLVEWGVISPVLKVYEHKVDGVWMVQKVFMD